MLNANCPIVRSIVTLCVHNTISQHCIVSAGNSLKTNDVLRQRKNDGLEFNTLFNRVQ